MKLKKTYLLILSIGGSSLLSSGLSHAEPSYDGDGSGYPFGDNYTINADKNNGGYFFGIRSSGGQFELGENLTINLNSNLDLHSAGIYAPSASEFIGESIKINVFNTIQKYNENFGFYIKNDGGNKVLLLGSNHINVNSNNEYNTGIHIEGKGAQHFITDQITIKNDGDEISGIRMISSGDLVVDLGKNSYIEGKNKSQLQANKALELKADGKLDFKSEDLTVKGELLIENGFNENGTSNLTGTNIHFSGVTTLREGSDDEFSTVGIFINDYENTADKKNNILFDRIDLDYNYTGGISIDGTNINADLGTDSKINIGRGIALSAVGQNVDVRFSGEIYSKGLGAVAMAYNNNPNQSVDNRPVNLHIKDSTVSVSTDEFIPFYGIRSATQAFTDNAILTLQNTTIKVDNKINPDDYIDYELNITSKFPGVLSYYEGLVNLEDVTIENVGSREIIGAGAILQGTINATGKLNIKLPDVSHYALFTDEDSLMNVDAKVDMVGSVRTGTKSTTTLKMKDESLWKGASLLDDTGKTHVSLRDNSTWFPTANSEVSSLHVTNSTVDLSQIASGHALTTHQLTTASTNTADQGVFLFRAQVNPNQPTEFDNLLIINNDQNSSSGAFIAEVANQGSFTKPHGHDAWTIIKTHNELPTNLSFASRQQVELGGYLYEVQPNSNNRDWDVVAVGTTPPVNPPVDPTPPVEPPVNPPVDPTPPVEPPVTPPVDPTPPPQPPIDDRKPTPPAITTTANAAANFLTIGYLLNMAEYETLMQRMGDLRLNKPTHNVWMHGFGGRYNSFSNAKLDGFRMNYQGLQLGADTRLSVDSPVYLGAFVGYTHGNPKPTDGSAKAKSYHGGIYATYIDEDLGFYVDGVMKLSHYKKEFSVLDTARQNVSGKSSSNALSVSLETGKRFHFNEPKNGWYLEPQLQYTYTRKDSTDFTATNGLNIHIDAYNSNLGRLSGVVGYEFGENKTEYNAYWKTGIVREFSGRGHYRLNGLTEDHYFRGNWWNNALGLNARINQQHDFYVELSSDHGNKFNRYHINGGYRFIF